MPEEEGTVVETTVAKPAESKASGKLFSEDYVVQLREEAKNTRLAKKRVEDFARKALGLKEDEELNEEKITTFNAKQQEVINKANARLIAAEIRSFGNDYDVKLVERLIGADSTGIEILDDGSVNGVKERIEALAVEFPQLKKTTTPPASQPKGVNPPQEIKTELDRLKEDLAKATNLQQKIALRNKIAALEKKG